MLAGTTITPCQHASTTHRITTLSRRDGYENKTRNKDTRHASIWITDTDRYMFMLVKLAIAADVDYPQMRTTRFPYGTEHPKSKTRSHSHHEVTPYNGQRFALSQVPRIARRL